MKTGKVTGFFNVRDFSTNRLKNEDEGIKFVVTYKDESEIPAEVKHRVRAYTNKHNEPRLAVEFKVSTQARWFNKFAQACTKPTNIELENVRYEAVIDFRDVVATEKYNAEKKKFNADGLYVNAIMINKVEINPFADDAFEQAPAEVNNATTEQAQQTQQTTTKAEKDDLPF